MLQKKISKLLWDAYLANVNDAVTFDADVLTEQIIAMLPKSATSLITDENRFNLLVSALEGGSNHWYYIKDKACDIIDSVAGQSCITNESTDRSFAQRMWDAIKAGKQIEVHDIENRELLGSISLESIERGEQTMIEKYDWHFNNILTENDDAETGDVWFQLAVMNEIVYG